MDEQKLLQKQLFWQRACAFACIGIFLVVLVCAILLVPRVNTIIASLDSLTQELLTVDWTSLAANLEKLTTTAQESLSALDVEGLNQAVNDLQKAVAPLARLFG